MFYVYEWYNVNTKYVFYVGKGTKNRHKQVKRRNKKFLEYYKNNNCDNRIVKYFEDEKKAFEYEHERICELKKLNQCSCNLDYGGKGGVNFVWTDEMRDYYSKYNVMKDKKQRERMSKNNPMKNKETILKVTSKTSKPMIIGDKEYPSIISVAREYNVTDTAIQNWIKRGYSRDLKPCYYKGNEIPTFVVNNHLNNAREVTINGKKFASQKEGAAYMKVCVRTLWKLMKDNKKTYKKFRLEY